MFTAIVEFVKCVATTPVFHCSWRKAIRFTWIIHSVSKNTKVSKTPMTTTMLSVLLLLERQSLFEAVTHVCKARLYS